MTLCIIEGYNMYTTCTPVLNDPVWRAGVFTGIITHHRHLMGEVAIVRLAGAAGVHATAVELMGHTKCNGI